MCKRMRFRIWYAWEMRLFFTLLRKWIWACIVMVIGSWIPWTVNLFLKDAFKVTVKELAGRHSVSLGVYQLLALAASYPVSACLILMFTVFCGACVYSTVVVSQHPGSIPDQTQGGRSLEGQQQETVRPVVAPVSAGMGITTEPGMTRGPNVISSIICELDQTTDGKGHQKVSLSFPPTRLRFYSPDVTGWLNSDRFPLVLASGLTVKLGGNEIVLEDH